MLATYSRIFITPFIFLVVLMDWPWAGYIASVLFILGSLTDWLDGYLARLYKVESDMGRFMDPIADKILVLAALILLLEMGQVNSIMVALLLCRDIFIGGLRSVAAAEQIVISAKAFGKWKTGFQMVAIPCLFIDDVFGLPIGMIGYVLIWISIILSLISGFQYTMGYYKGVKAQ